MLRNYDAPNQKVYLNIFKGLKHEITSMEEKGFELRTSFMDLSSLHIWSNKSLIPFWAQL